MAGTLLLAVRESVIDGVQSLPEFALEDAKGHTPLVTLGWAWDKKHRERAYTQNARFTHAPASLRAGRTFRNETGQFEFSLWIEGPGQSVAETSARAVELGTAFEEFISDHRTGLEVPGLNWIAIDGDGRLDEALIERGSMAQLIYPVRYDARLT